MNKGDECTYVRQKIPPTEVTVDMLQLLVETLIPQQLHLTRIERTIIEKKPPVDRSRISNELNEHPRTVRHASIIIETFRIVSLDEIQFTATSTSIKIVFLL